METYALSQMEHNSTKSPPQHSKPPSLERTEKSPPKPPGSTEYYVDSENLTKYLCISNTVGMNGGRNNLYLWAGPEPGLASLLPIVATANSLYNFNMIYSTPTSCLPI